MAFNEERTPASRRGRRARLGLIAGAIAAAAGLVLSGCSGSGGSAPSGGSNTLTVWHYFSDPNQVKVMTDYADLFEKDNKGVTVKNVYVPYDQMDQKLIASAGAKTGPDVVVFNGADASNLALSGALAPLDSKWSSFADKGQFPSSVVHKLNGKTYAVQGYVNLLGLWYNKDILDAAGVKPPTTLDELDSAMAKVKTAGKSGITLSGLPNSQGEWQAYPWLTAAGFDLAKPSTKALTDGLSRVSDWVSKGYLSKESTTWDQTVPFQKFAAGDVAFAENGNWQIGTAKSTAKFNYGVVPLPLGSKGKVYLGGEGEGIGAFSKNQDLAWKYLQATYYSKAGQLIALKDSGTIPARADTASDSAVTGDPLIKPFAESVSKLGANYPDEAVPAAGVANQQLAGGQAWSSVLGGSASPSDAAAAYKQQLDQVLSAK
ncbi:sugar ABC transporter substrate-binding protein [Leifsonia sp. 21MFCrub1.1]|uniref:sugar ABC transporter substrate-binding protein n=1 Tax=Leifsonia sp. 21MFCrub1.1 TaxID=1798223 RepID=UPI000892A2FD|nr:sugar ABC transporter substrate-binding protein [Leifsonia sp. 21MFCrub1.1]SEB08778.1 multiple sugar transport system substrate-binding protein [Leifsonia sp. 21MFCrub1.1]